ncbi:hypothetical protein BsWGS_24231 [Bradybaena similaris]
MERHTAVFMLCIHSCLVLSTSPMPVPAFKEMKVPAESPSEITGKLTEMRLSPPISVSADLKNQAGDLIMRNDETENDNDDGDILSHIPQTGSDPEKKSSIYEEKRRLRLVKRGESGNDKNVAEHESRRRSLRKREAGNRHRRSAPWSVSNALSTLTYMVVEQEQARLAAEREALKRRLLELGKRSEDDAARRADTASRSDQDFASFLQAALSSSES